MSIKMIKLITGEELIAEVSAGTTSEDVLLTNIVQVVPVPTRAQNGQPNFGFVPYPLISNDKSIEIKRAHILFPCNPSEEFLQQYNQIFGTGLIVPTKKLVV